MSAEILFSKTGTTATTGETAGALPASDTADAKGLPIFNGLYSEQPFEFAFTKSTVNCTFGLEGTLDGSTWSPMAFVRCDTGATVASVTLSATGRVIAKPVLSQHLHSLRPVAYTSAGAAAGDEAIVRCFKRS